MHLRLHPCSYICIFTFASACMHWLVGASPRARAYGLNPIWGFTRPCPHKAIASQGCLARPVPGQAGLPQACPWLAPGLPLCVCCPELGWRGPSVDPALGHTAKRHAAKWWADAGPNQRCSRTLAAEPWQRTHPLPRPQTEPPATGKRQCGIQPYSN